MSVAGMARDEERSGHASRGGTFRMILPAPPRLCAVLLLACGALPVTGAAAGVRVHTGPTPIPEGTAQGARDITLENEHLAVAFAVDTAGPWGVARGGIVDVAVVRDGRIDRDRASLVDFMPNDWSSWPTTRQRVTIVTDTPEEAVLRTERDWGEVDLVTTWRLRSGEDTLHVHTRMHNRGRAALTKLLSGYVLWPEGGHLFGVPGADPRESGPVEHPLADWSAAYDRSWMMGLHAPFARIVGDGGRDRYQQHDLAPGESCEFEAWLQVAPRGELAPLVAHPIAAGSLPSGRLAGTVRTADGAAVAEPGVIVEARAATGWTPYAWSLGRDGSYALALPVGRYRVHAAAEAHADSAAREIEVRAGAESRLDFDDLQPPGGLAIRVTGGAERVPLDARIGIEAGPVPMIRHFGQSTFFTSLDRRGEAELRLAPGDYRLTVDAGAGFRAPLLHLNVRRLWMRRSTCARTRLRRAGTPPTCTTTRTCWTGSRSRSTCCDRNSRPGWTSRSSATTTRSPTTGRCSVLRRCAACPSSRPASSRRRGRTSMPTRSTRRRRSRSTWASRPCSRSSPRHAAWAPG
jgi:hypothetical protein